MRPMITPRTITIAVAVLLLIGLAAVPVLGKPPGGTPLGQANNAERTPGVPVTLDGTVGTAVDDEGNETYTLTVDGTVYELSAGPSWWWGDDHPLKAFVGKSVTIDGEQDEGTSEIDVHAVNGTQIRAAGKPPWAGGWKAVGERHPGWSQAKADRFAAKFGDCFPPGRCKNKPAEDAPAE